MKSIWTTYQAWLERRRQKNLEWWKRKRAKGKLWYVLWVTVMWGGLMIVFTTLADYFIDGKLHVERLNFKIIYYLIGGFIVGLAGWWGNERNYQKSLRAKLDNNSQAE